MRLLNLLLALMIAAPAVQAGFIPTDVGGPIGARGSGEGGVRVTAMVAVDGARPLISVRSEPGFEHGLGVYVPAANQKHLFAAAKRHRQVIVPEVHVSANDLVRVVLRGGAGSDSLTFFDELVPVVRGGGPGVQVDWQLDGPMPPIALVTVGLGYPTELAVGLAATGPSGIARYEAFSSTLLQDIWTVQLEMPAAVSVADGAVLTAYVTPRLTGPVFQPVAEEINAPWTVARPAAPAALAAVAADSTVTVTWDPLAAVHGYRAYRKRASAPWERYEGFHNPLGSGSIPSVFNLGGPTGFIGKDFTIAHEPSTDRFHLIGIDATVAWNWAGCTSDLSLCGEKEFYHSSTVDFTSAAWHEPIKREHLCQWDGSTWRIDGHQVEHLWAPHLSQHDGYWHLFFTGVDRVNPAADRRIERIFKAKMPITADIKDPSNWTDSKFVLDGSGTFPSPPSGITSPTGWNTTLSHRALCRDPFVKFNRTDGLWYMVMTVAATGGGEAIGVARAPDIEGPWTMMGFFNALGAGTRESASLIYWPEQGRWILGYNQGGAGAWAHTTAFPGTWTVGGTTFSGWRGYEVLDLPVQLRDGTELGLWPYRNAEAATWLAVAINFGAGTVLPRSLIARMDGGTFRLTTRTPALTEHLMRPNAAGRVLVDRLGTPGVSHQYTVAGIAGQTVTAQAAPAAVTPYRDVAISNLTAGYGVLQGNYTVSVEPREVAWQWRSRSHVTTTEVDCSDNTGYPAWSAWTTIQRPTNSASVSNITVATDRWLNVQVEVRSASNQSQVHTACTSYYRPNPPPQPTNVAGSCTFPGCTLTIGSDTFTLSWDNVGAAYPGFEGYWVEIGNGPCNDEVFVPVPESYEPGTWDNPAWRVQFSFSMPAGEDCAGYYTFAPRTQGNGLSGSPGNSILTNWVE